MIKFEVYINDKLYSEADVAFGDQLETAVFKLVGDEGIGMVMTAFLPTSLESKKYLNWEYEYLDVGDEIRIKLTKAEAAETTQITDHTEPENEEKAESSLFCSFCGKGDLEVRKVICGEEGNICDECIELCYSVIEDEKQR
ncbi:hypothetical protein H0A36_09670 [Endozoicomonas sp. SM1973]|uniref:ClpX-type ZB domain-containing protein n=1 Tax=Spartinivicinus marinus TaxID=2994442 RepID=A0A853I0Y3_9GAMM|nr:ClpX C4-type zinc finger protein [Spartinivicinus marinus]MCX4024694.1 hypothetical protein [Spartinivicinus marinus]NYZ66279.1 hypothetical protein [Spartinivicinus marinus]